MSDQPTLYKVHRGATINESDARVLERILEAPTDAEILAVLGVVEVPYCTEHRAMRWSTNRCVARTWTDCVWGRAFVESDDEPKAGL